MTDDAIRVPAGLTTDGLPGRRYIARFIDSVLITLLILVVVALKVVLVPTIEGGLANLLVNLLFLLLLFILWIGYGTAFMEKTAVPHAMTYFG
jgi:RDD family